MSAERHVLDLPEEKIEDTQHELISSRRVEGTRIYNRAGEKLGTVHSVMLNKRSGQVAYAVMSFGGFLGFDALVHPLPWEMLSFDEHRNAYVVDLTRAQLEAAPTFRIDEADRPRHRSQDEQIFSYYGFPYL